MSDLAKTFAKAKLSSMPPPDALLPEEPPEYEDDSSSASSMSSTGTVIPTSTQRPAPAIHWSDYFAQEFYLERKATAEVHGENGNGTGDNNSNGDRNTNGSSATTPRKRAKFHVYVTPPAHLKAPLLVLHHGAGSSGMSFALFAREARKLMPEVGVLAVEARDHGSVVWSEDGAVDNDLSVELLSQDLLDMVQLTQVRMGWPDMPTVVLIGHSLGGAVVTDAASKGLFGSRLLGFGVLDVVEGSAMEAIQHMQTYLASRPKTFATLEAAVEWHIRSRTLRNPQSARVSVPSLLLQNAEGRWAWKTELTTTEPYWENWFAGMSSKFLNGKGAKLLLLAGTDRLDKELMIGQMQGKFQLQVFPASGHFLQEDQPEKTAEVVVEFVKRNDRSMLVLPPKVSDLLAQGKKV